MQPEAPEAFAAFIGLAWADATPDSCLQAADSKPRAYGTLDHTPDAIEAWGCALPKRFGGKPIALCLELNQGPIVFALRKYHFLGLFPVTPLPLARYREAFPPSRAKDDPTDAELPRELLRPHRDKWPPLTPQSPSRRAVAHLVEHRQRVVGDKVRITNRRTSTLKNYCPQARQWLQDKAPVIFCDFLRHWPTLKAAHLARRSTLETFCRAPHGRSADVLTQRLHAIKAAPP